jgi:acetyl esterase
MPLHPQAEAALARTSAPAYGGEVDVETERARARAEAADQPREAVATVLDVDADGVPCRLYVPDGAAPGLLVHLHGGGFVFNDVEVHDAAARSLANRTGVAVLSVDYRRPPEQPFPAAVEDVDRVLSWVGSGADDAGRLWQPGPTYLHGDSAGANLALVGALHHPGRVTALALTYPFLDPTRSFPSYDEVTVGMSPEDCAWAWRQYVRDEADLSHPDVAPLRSDRLGTLPPTLVLTAEYDVLRDEGEELAARLAALGVPTVATRYLGQIHGFWRHPEAFDAAEVATGQIAGFLRSRKPA